MPFYIFKKDEEYVEVFFHMNDEKFYNGPNGDEEGQWKRVYTVPNAAIATKIDPFSKSQFIRSMDGKSDTIGEHWDRAKEMSERRADQNGGVDPVKQKHFEQYKKDRNGAVHPEDRPKEVKTPNLNLTT